MKITARSFFFFRVYYHAVVLLWSVHSFYCCIMRYLSFRSQANFFSLCIFLFALPFAPNPSIHIWVISAMKSRLQCCMYADALSYRQLFCRRHRSYISTTLCSWSPGFVCLTFTRKRPMCPCIQAANSLCSALCQHVCVCSECVSVCELNIPLQSSWLHDCILNYPAKMTMDKMFLSLGRLQNNNSI